MSAPAVQSFQDILSGITNAYKPQQDAIDSEIQGNDQSGTAQVAGLDAAKTNAFGGINQEASNKGMVFSGFTPDAEAKYTGSTYLPALAKLQGVIASTRDSLLGKKADIATQANTTAQSELTREQSAAQAWQDEQDKEAFQASQNALDRTNSSNNARISAGGGAAADGGSPATDLINGFKSFLGSGGKLSATNTKNNRQAQDAYIKTWMINNGVLDPGAQNQIWSLVNQTFGRTNDPTKDWTYKK